MPKKALHSLKVQKRKEKKTYFARICVDILSLDMLKKKEKKKKERKPFLDISYFVTMSSIHHLAPQLIINLVY